MNIYIYRDGHETGPLDESTVEARLRDRSLSPKDLARRETDKEWTPLEMLFPLAGETGHSWMEDSGGLPRSESQQQGSRPVHHQEQQRPSAPPYYQPAPPAYQSVQHVVHHTAIEPEGSLPIISLVGGIILFCLFLLGLVPCLGWLNWFVILGGGITKIFCWVSVFTTNNPQGRTKAIIGLVLTTIALFFGTIRLILGGGCV
ncbi:MAG TPA: GYF domain-containing protein [Pyrinomonadaceae bacterium]|nr:GYF domain-containing protein [Pyrinomonadaceae bacterium]